METIEKSLLAECDKLLALIREGTLDSKPIHKIKWDDRMDATLDIRNRITKRTQIPTLP